MAHVEETAEFTASAEDLWKVVGDFGGFIAALGMPAEIDGEGIGQTRTIALGAEPTVERLEELDPAAMRLVYSIVKGAMPMENYRSTMIVTATDEGGSHLSWSATFDPIGSEEDAVNLVRAIYQGGIGGLRNAVAR